MERKRTPEEQEACAERFARLIEREERRLARIVYRLVLEGGCVLLDTELWRRVRRNYR